MRKIVATLLACLVLLPAFAQSRKIGGTVRDENGDVLAGAIVVVKSGGAQGAVAATATTDATGRYSVQCKEGDYLSVHFLGYTDNEFPVKGKSNTIDVTMTRSQWCSCLW